MPEQHPADDGATAATDSGEKADSGGQVPTLFDLVGYSIAAAHASSAASAAQLTVALAAYRLLQRQRDSLGVDGAILEELLSGATKGSEALPRILGRADTGGGARMPRTFNERRPGDSDETSATSDSAATRRE